MSAFHLCVLYADVDVDYVCSVSNAADMQVRNSSSSTDSYIFSLRVACPKNDFVMCIPCQALLCRARITPSQASAKKDDCYIQYLESPSAEAVPIDGWCCCTVTSNTLHVAAAETSGAVQKLLAASACVVCRRCFNKKLLTDGTCVRYTVSKHRSVERTRTLLRCACAYFTVYGSLRPNQMNHLRLSPSNWKVCSARKWLDTSRALPPCRARVQRPTQPPTQRIKHLHGRASKSQPR